PREALPFSLSSQLRRELRQIVDAERLLDRGDPIDHLLESIFAEQVMLFLLEVFAERRELLFRHDLTQRREQHGILSRQQRTPTDNRAHPQKRTPVDRRFAHPRLLVHTEPSARSPTPAACWPHR